MTCFGPARPALPRLGEADRLAAPRQQLDPVRLEMERFRRPTRHRARRIPADRRKRGLSVQAAELDPPVRRGGGRSNFVRQGSSVYRRLLRIIASPPRASSDIVAGSGILL